MEKAFEKAMDELFSDKDKKLDVSKIKSVIEDKLKEYKNDNKIKVFMERLEGKRGEMTFKEAMALLS